MSPQVQANTTNMIIGETLKLRRKLLVGVMLEGNVNWSDIEIPCLRQAKAKTKVDCGWADAFLFHIVQLGRPFYAVQKLKVSCIV